MNEQKMNYEHVLSPIKIGPMTLKNRVSFTPVWPSFATADGHVNRELIEWVRDIVKGGAACINIGCGCVNRNLPPFVTHLLRMSEESVVNEMTILSDLVHMYQCKIGIELFAINMYGGNFADRDHNGDKPAVELGPTYMTKEQMNMARIRLKMHQDLRWNCSLRFVRRSKIVWLSNIGSMQMI